MRYTSFHIENYKGIKEIDIDLANSPDFKVYSFIGLNESGKSTILEAMNDCQKEVPVSRRYELIPKGEAGGFTGQIRISAMTELDDNDIIAIKKYVTDDLKIRCVDISVPRTSTVTRTYFFENASPTGATYESTFYPKIKKTNSSKNYVSLDKDSESKLWSHTKKYLQPEIIFYRDFLSKFPDKVYLVPEESDIKGEEYLGIIEDVLTSINPRYNVESSLLKRLRDKTPADQQALEAVENELGQKISKVVFEAWNKIQQVSKKEIVVKSGADSEGKFFLKLTVKDGGQSFSIAERSLGFRWFFTFLLYTEFRKERIITTGEPLFLLDEPASNLHQAAQKSLLSTFQNIVTKARLVYTTHSHHLINPEWLDNAYVVKNKGLQYIEDDNFTTINTEIEAKKYKVFASEHPDQTSYFQPILDVLDYQPGLLENVPKIVINEGKFDYATFTYFRDVVLKRSKTKFSFYPGQGATKLDLPISLYESWSRPYIVLLDSDKEGHDQKKRYIKEYSDETKVFTLKDIDAKFVNISTEDLFTANEKLMISKEYESSLTSYNKSAFNTGIRTLQAEGRVPRYITQGTKDKMTKIINFIEANF